MSRLLCTCFIVLSAGRSHLTTPPLAATVLPCLAQAWKKFQEEGSAGWRPEGRSAYTTQELASARATRVINEMRSSVPSPNEVVRDSRFWFALLVALALAPSLYTAFQATSHSGDVLV